MDQRVEPQRTRRSELRWPGMRTVYGWFPPDGDVTVSQPQQIGVSFATHRGIVADYRGRTERFDVRPGDVFANGHDPRLWSEVGEPDEIVEIYLDDDVLRAAAGSSAPPELEPLLGVRDTVVLGTATVLKRAHMGSADLDDVRASTLAHRLAEHVVGHYAGAAPPVRPARGRLDRAQLDRVADMVEDRLADPLTVDDLAAAATLSPFHFARTFKASTGLAPHEYVTSRRMERAKTLLLTTGMNVPAVAHSVGLTNLSHFRRTFRRHTGFMPSQLRHPAAASAPSVAAATAKTAESDPPPPRSALSG